MTVGEILTAGSVNSKCLSHLTIKLIEGEGRIWRAHCKMGPTTKWWPSQNGAHHKMVATTKWWPLQNGTRHKWRPLQNGTRHKMGPTTKCGPSQNGAYHKIWTTTNMDHHKMGPTCPACLPAGRQAGSSVQQVSVCCYRPNIGVTKHVTVPWNFAIRASQSNCRS
jgi:hypothetical protein